MKIHCEIPRNSALILLLIFLKTNEKWRRPHASHILHSHNVFVGCVYQCKTMCDVNSAIDSWTDMRIWYWLMRIVLHGYAKCLGNLMTASYNTGYRSQCCTAFINNGLSFLLRYLVFLTLSYSKHRPVCVYLLVNSLTPLKRMLSITAVCFQCF